MGVGQAGEATDFFLYTLAVFFFLFFCFVLQTGHNSLKFSSGVSQIYPKNEVMIRKFSDRHLNKSVIFNFCWLKFFNSVVACHKLTET